MANVLLLTLKQPPPRGSPREFVLCALVLKKEEIELAKTRAMVQSLIKQDAGPEAWEMYFHSVYPWIETAKKREKDEWITRLQEEVKRGPLKVSVSGNQKEFRSRLKTRVIETTQGSVKDPEFMRQLTQKLQPYRFRGK